MRSQVAVLLFLLPLLFASSCDDSSSDSPKSAVSTESCAEPDGCGELQEEPGPAVPEPSSLIMGLAGFLMIRWSLRRHNR